MPIYEYRCTCGSKFEVRQKEFEPKPTYKCPKCGREADKTVSMWHSHYKGAGFYITEERGITGRKRKPDIKVGYASDLEKNE